MSLLDLSRGEMNRAKAPGRGQVVADRYRIRSLLGVGGMGRVLLAEDELLQRRVALKSYHTQEPNGADGARLLNEARAAARVDHPGLVRIYDVAREGQVLWIVMEALSGRSLAQILAVDGPLPIHRATDVGLQLLDVLKAVHRAGIVHRDVKPANVHLCADGRVVLTDFGIASFAGSETNPDTLGGSPGYLSPEQVQGSTPEPASDLFSFGATLYASVEGHAPFDRGELSDSLIAVLRGTAQPGRAGPLRPIIDRLLVKHPERRLTADQVESALKRII